MSLGLVEAAYEKFAYFSLQPDWFRIGFSVPEPLGPITETEYLRRKKRDEDYEKGRLLYEQAKELGFHAECDHD